MLLVAVVLLERKRGILPAKYKAGLACWFAFAWLFDSSFLVLCSVKHMYNGLVSCLLLLLFARRPPAVDPALLKSMKVVDFVGTAPNPRNRLRNQVALFLCL